MNANDEILNVLTDMFIRLIEEDPSKIAEAYTDADLMIEHDADFGLTREELAGEYIVYAFKVANREEHPDIVESVEANEKSLEDAVISHLKSKVV